MKKPPGEGAAFDEMLGEKRLSAAPRTSSRSRGTPGSNGNGWRVARRAAQDADISNIAISNTARSSREAGPI
jgi:hypothetical protein